MTRFRPMEELFPDPDLVKRHREMLEWILKRTYVAEVDMLAEFGKRWDDMAGARRILESIKSHYARETRAGLSLMARGLAECTSDRARGERKSIEQLREMLRKQLPPEIAVRRNVTPSEIARALDLESTEETCWRIFVIADDEWPIFGMTLQLDSSLPTEAPSAKSDVNSTLDALAMKHRGPKLSPVLYQITRAALRVASESSWEVPEKPPWPEIDRHFIALGGEIEANQRGDGYELRWTSSDGETSRVLRKNAAWKKRLRPLLIAMLNDARGRLPGVPERVPDFR